MTIPHDGLPLICPTCVPVIAGRLPYEQLRPLPSGWAFFRADVARCVACEGPGELVDLESTCWCTDCWVAEVCAREAASET